MEEKALWPFFLEGGGVELELKTNATVNLQIMSPPKSRRQKICEMRKNNDNLAWFHIKIVVEVDWYNKLSYLDEMEPSPYPSPSAKRTRSSQNIWVDQLKEIKSSFILTQSVIGKLFTQIPAFLLWLSAWGFFRWQQTKNVWTFDKIFSPNGKMFLNPSSGHLIATFVGDSVKFCSCYPAAIWNHDLYNSTK